MDQSTHEIRVREWSQIIQDCNASGLTKKEWCLQYHINEKSFYYWQRVIRRDNLLPWSETLPDICRSSQQQ